jgi:energy-converting hydrogenase Eha subunit E
VFALTRLLASVLFGVSATDAVSFTGALVIVLGGVIQATIGGARRGSIR